MVDSAKVLRRDYRSFATVHQNGVAMGVGATTVSTLGKLSPRLSRLRAAGLLACLLSACGGSGGGSSTPATYTIGGSVSELTASGLVLANGSATLAVSSGSSSFTFPTAVATGTSYDISVESQPAGETCAPDNPTGTVGTGNVNNITVHCFNPGTGTGWLSYTDYDSSTGVSSLLILQASSIPNAAPVTVASSATISGYITYWASSNVTLNGTHWDYALIFWGTGSDGNQHLYSVNLTDATSTAPVLTQISDLSLPGIANLCYSTGWLQENLGDPDSAFIIVDINTSASACGSASDTWKVVHMTDSASTTPVLTTSKPSYVTPLYAPSGALSGLIALDPSSHDLGLYDATFSNPTVFASNIDTSAEGGYTVQIADYNSDGNGHYLGDTIFLNVSSSEVSAGQSSIWRISYSGSVSKIYSTTGRLAGVVDGNNLHRTDNTFDASSGMATKSLVYQVAATASAPTPLLLTSGAVNSESGWNAVGSNNAVLVLEQTISDTQAELAYVKVGVPNQTPTPIGGNSSSPGIYTENFQVELNAFLAGKTPEDYAGALLYVTVYELFSTPHAGYLEDYATQIMSPTGRLMTGSANSAFIDPGLPYLGLRHGHVLGVMDIPSGSTFLGGGALADYPAGSITSTSITANGSPFLLPDEPYVDAYVGAVSDIVGGSSGAADFAGGIVHEGLVGHPGNEYYGLAINLQSDTAQLLDLSPNEVEFLF